MIWLYGLGYFFYAFTQASVQVRMGHEAGDDYSPLRDLVVFFVFAPLISAFFMLVGPFTILDKYARALRTVNR